MNATKPLTSLFAMLCLCWAGLTFAGDALEESQVQATVNINEASAETLAKVLDGVGLSRAQAIVQYRNKNGRFYSAEELSAVRGIGTTTVTKNEDKIVVK